MIKAVIFDVDGVLLDSLQANLRFFQMVLKEAGYREPTLEEYQPIFHLTMKDALAKLTGAADTELDRIFTIGKSMVPQYPTSLLTMPPDAIATIQKLSEKYVLGIVTSRVRDGVYIFPDMSKIKNYFQTTITYEDTKEHKPHPEPLNLVAKKLGVNNDECVYIGDAKSDIDAANQAGMKIIAYTRSKLEGADVTTSNFADIPELVSEF